MKFIPAFISLLLLAACNGTGRDPQPETPPVKMPDMLSYSIVATYPHDTNSYTQGLLVYKGEMYEGTGREKESKLMRVDIKTGKPGKSISLDNAYFGEGVTILNDTVYQLTWQNKKVFVYTLKDFKKIKEFNVDFEGWGLTNDGKNLIVSTGTGDLFFYEPSGFKLLRSLAVTDAGSPTFNLNELEYIDGYVYANQYTYPYIFKIDPNTGEIVSKIDLSTIWARIQQMRPGINAGDIVPNGIAYDAATKKIYITGKWWPELYEVQFSQ